LPIYEYVTNLEEFIIEHFDFKYGRSYHAFSACLQGIVEEFKQLVCEVEFLAHTEPFTLQKLWFYVSPSIKTFETLNSLVESVKTSGRNPREYMLDSGPNGGILLSTLAERMITLGGNTEVKKLYEHLLYETSIPFVDILTEWVSTGNLNDPDKEFMVGEKLLDKERLKDDYNDVYWEQRYQIQNDFVPTFFEKYKEKILQTGKYLNVLRECSIDVSVELKDDKHGNLGEALKAIRGQRFLLINAVLFQLLILRMKRQTKNYWI
jgi:gamma-tubulin complex component 2